MKINQKLITITTILFLLMTTPIHAATFPWSQNTEEEKESQLKENQVQVKINTPEGKSAYEDTTVTLHLLKSMSLEDYYTKECIIKKGEKESVVEFKVPKGEYELWITMKNEEGKYLNRTHFLHEELSSSIDSTSIIEVHEDTKNTFNIELIEATKLSGKISLPKNSEPLKNDLIIEIGTHETESDTYHNKEVVLKAGSREIEYDINTLQGTNILSYTLKNGESTVYIEAGYYNSNGVVSHKLEAETIEVSKLGVEDIDIVIPEGKLISGSIYMPNKKPITNRPTPFNLKLQKKVGDEFLDIPTSYKNVEIDVFKPSTEYNYKVLPGEYILSYKLYDGDTMNASIGVGIGYYNKNNVVHVKEEATIINIGMNDLKNIDIEMTKGIQVSGEISIKNNERGTVFITPFKVISAQGKTKYAKMATYDCNINKELNEYSFYIPKGAYIIVFSEEPITHIENNRFYNYDEEDILKWERIYVNRLPVENLTLEL